MGIVLSSGDCRILFANREAEELVGARIGLRYERGRLVAANPALAHRLEALARAGSWPKLGAGEPGGTIELSRGDDHPPLVADVVPLAANRAAAKLEDERPAVVVFVVDPAAGLDARVRRFAPQFELTGAEKRELAELIRGAERSTRRTSSR